MTVPAPWFAARQRPDSPAPRVLVCVPFAGGGIGIYGTWQAKMPADIEVLRVQLPGRERRIQERPYLRMRALLDDLWPATAEALAGRPWAVFGHSMGAGIAYELARAGAAAGTPPFHLFVSARRAPGTAGVHPPLFALPTDRLLAETERLYGPMPAAAKAHPSLLASTLKTMRADFELLDTWVAPEDAVLGCPVTAYGGTDDTAHPPASLDGWSNVTTGPFRKVVLDGDHFSYVRGGHGARDDVVATLRG